MSTSKISLASSYFFYFLLITLINLYSIKSLKVDAVLVYSVSSEKNFKIGKSQTSFIIDGIVHVRPSLSQKNTLIAKLKTLNITAKSSDDTELNLYECKSSENLKEAFLKPFALVYDSNGLLQKIKVTEGEPSLVSNLKLILSSLLQINTNKLTEQNEAHFTADANEPIIYGNCDVKYNIKNLFSKSYTIDKEYDISTCTLVNDTFKDAYLTEVCNSAEDKRFKNCAVQDMDLLLTNPVGYKRSYILEQISYKPFKKSPQDRLNIVLITVGKLLPKIEIHAISDNDVNVEVSGPIYTKVNKSIFQDKLSLKNRDLRQIYKALACDSYNMNPYIDIVERLIMC